MSDSESVSSEGVDFVPAEISTFLGVRLSSSKSFLVEPESVAEVFEFTSVAVHPSCKDKAVSVQIETEGGAFIIATLRPGKTDQCLIDLQLNEQAEISLASGKGPVDLVGRVTLDTEMYSNFGAEDMDDEDEDDEDYEVDEDDEDEDEDEDEGPKIEDVTDEVGDDENEEEEEIVKPKKTKKQKQMEKQTPKKEQKQKQTPKKQKNVPNKEQKKEDAKTPSKKEQKKKENNTSAKSAKNTPKKKNDPKTPKRAAEETQTPSKKAKKTPKKQKAADLSVGDMLKKVMQSPNKPKAEKKFVNHVSTMFNMQKDDERISTLWKKYSSALSNDN
eukprot:m.29170 g.29170  ORF g.29170 m.29170 type:complete len:330 (-) comp9543_c0_seq1:130-1119(-)